MIFRSVSGGMAVLAVFAAYLQLNDPDPERWVALYLACAAVAVASTLGQSSSVLSLGVALVAGAWALAILPELVNDWSPRELLDSMQASRPQVEYGREF